MISARKLVLVIFSACFILPVHGVAADNSSDFLPMEMLVKFKHGKEEKGNQEIKKIGAKVKERLSTIDVSRLKLPPNLEVEKAVKQFSKLSIVEYAEPNYIQKAFWSPSDTYFSKQWGMTKIQAVSGWSIHTGRAATVIAIVDTGVDLDHPDLKDKLVQGYDYVDNDDVPDDVGGHGTHCAGIAAASSNNKKGVAGVCPNCSIMPVRVLGPDGGSSTDVAKGIVFAADHGAKVISMSLGSYMLSSTIQDAVEYANDKGVVLVAASGNSGVNAPHYPAYFEQCIAVGSTDRKDKQSSFSNYGAWVDVAAPGEDIYSTVPGGEYDYKSGTSMAAPHVAGLAGVMASCPNASQARIKQAILNSAVPVGDWVAKGRIDVKAALKSMGCDSTDTPPPTSPSTPDPKTETGTPDKGSSDAESPTPTPEKGTPTAYTVKVQQGTVQSEKPGALDASDDNRLALSSKGTGFSNFLDFSIEIPLETAKTYSALTLTLEGMTANPGTFEVHLFDWNKGEYQKVTATRLESADRTETLSVPDAAGFVDDKGRVKIRFFRQEKRWNGFDIGLDLLTVKGAESATPPKTSTPSKDKEEEKKEGESLSNKAKRKWDNWKKKL